MRIPFVDLKAQYNIIKPKIDQAIAGVVGDSSFVGGEIVENFEKSFAEYIGLDYGIGCANGTDAIEIALEALGIGHGDEVLVPAYSWVSTASAVSRVGGEPVFVDVHPDYYTMDASQIEGKITPKTKAIIPVHFYGLPAEMPAIIEMARKHKLFVIEDCAQSHGAMIEKQNAGTFGDIATFSFYPGKNLGAYGDGGAIVTSDERLAKKCRIIAGLGQDGKHNHVRIGRNSRLDTFQAAILSVKLPMLEEWTAKRRWVARQYNMQFSDTDIKVQRIPTDYKHVYHIYAIQVNKRDELKAFLEKKGIHAQIHYPKPLNQLKLFKDRSAQKVADSMARRLLSLPIYPEMTQDQIKYVTDNLKKFIVYGD